MFFRSRSLVCTFDEHGSNGSVGKMITVEEAINAAVSMVSPITDTCSIPLTSAHGKSCSRDIYAKAASPAFDNSAMDGFAINFEAHAAALAASAPIPLGGTVAAGDAGNCGLVDHAAAIRIFTGAPLPPEFDTVIPQENCARDVDCITVGTMPARGDNVRLRGEDVGVGDLLLASGTVIDGRQIAVLAADGLETVEVIRAPRVGVVSTGNELKTIDKAGGSGIFDVNRPMLLALLRACGAEVYDLGILPDEPRAIAEFLARTSDFCELLVTSGGASVGERDFLRPALMAAGGQVDAHKVALKPGKPVFFGRLHSMAVTGLPGNPLSCYVGFQLFVSRQLAALRGLPVSPEQLLSAPLRDALQRKIGRKEYVPCRLDSAGRLVVLKHGGSASLKSISEAQGVMVLDADVASVEAGGTVTWIEFDERKHSSSWRVL